MSRARLGPGGALRRRLLAAACLAPWLPLARAAAPDMQAIVIREYGPAGVLGLERVPRPVPGPGELLVRVHAAGVNPVDAAIRGGYLAERLGTTLPYVPGLDLSGTIAASGGDTPGFALGEAVFAMIDLRRGGAYAEYAIVRPGEAARRPRNLSDVEAASLPLVALTAWEALFDAGGLASGQRVLVHAAAGGVGTAAVQLAKWRGATVIATASADNHEFLRGLGADEVIDYRTERFEERLRGLDLVLDPVGGDTQRRSLGVLRDGGALVSLVGLVPEARQPPRGLRTQAILVGANGARLAEVAALAEAGTLRPVVSHVFPLAEAWRAHEQSETRRTRGKIVLATAAEG